MFRPASNMKIIISSASLKALSKDFSYNTKLYIDGVIKNETLFGNIVVLGSGDPSFTVDKFYIFLSSLKKYKIKKITGNIIGIDAVFDDEHIGVLWSWNDLSNCFSAQISGLQINSNCVGISVKPNKTLGYPAKISKVPNTSYVTILNNTSTSNEKTDLTFNRRDNTNYLYIRGNINIKEQVQNKWLSINNPSNYFLTLFYEYLLDKNIEIQGGPIKAKEIGYKLNKNRAFEISNVKSKNLLNLNNDFLKYSLNLYGESILKTLGSIYFNEGSTYNGRLAINLIFKDYGLANEELFIADGSGLSNLNLISPSFMTSLLYSINKGPFFSDFFNSLSVSGLSGTLKNRFTSLPLKGSIHAKTGCISNARTLSGYIDTVNGKKLAFAIFANNYNNKLLNSEAIIEKTCLVLRKY